MMIKLFHTIVFSIYLLFLVACSNNNRELSAALKMADSNRKELEAVLNHYKNEPQKLEAARYLIKNMPYHYSMDEYYLSPSGEKYRPNISYFINKDIMKEHCDSLLTSGYRVIQNKERDIQVIDSAFLVNNIDLAFLVWKKPWNNDLSFDDFCKYILPYRAQTERPSDLRRHMMEKFITILDSAEVKSSLDACIVLNEQLEHIMRYQDTGLSFYPTIEETYYSGISRCEGLCDLGTFIMRSVGIPVTVDRTTWVKMDLGHSWCVVLNKGEFHSFGPGEDNPLEHAKAFSKVRYRRPAKVYRSRFNPITTKDRAKDDGYVTHLKSPLIYDVTEEYLDKPITFQVYTDKNNLGKRNSKQIYLCVFNFYEWKPIAIGNILDSICTFEKVVGDNIFIVADSPDSKSLRFITAPFYVDGNGKVHKFIPDMQHKTSMSLEKRKGKEQIPHTLFYWDTNGNNFVPLSYETSSDSTLFYSEVPANALLWFTIPERIVNQRVFFIENDSIKKY